jgi:hypothetical protein
LNVTSRRRGCRWRWQLQFDESTIARSLNTVARLLRGLRQAQPAMHQVRVQAAGQRDGRYRSPGLLTFGNHLRLQLRAVPPPRRSWLGCHNVHFRLKMDIISERFKVSRWDCRALTAQARWRRRLDLETERPAAGQWIRRRGGRTARKASSCRPLQATREARRAPGDA